MMIYISCAKTMASRSKLAVPFTTQPAFQAEAEQIALSMSQFPAEELGKLLHINAKLAAENYFRYHNFFSEDNPGLPALHAYTGIVFKRINAKDFTEDDLTYAQDHLRISSFLYGLVRPLDLIRNYRLEGSVKLPEKGGITLFDYWKPIMTDYFIQEIKKQGGLLVNLASAEMKDLLDWKRVCSEVKVVTPEFQVYKNGKPATVVIYAKMCRGEMTRFLLKNRITDTEALKAFEWEGFAFNEKESDEHRLVFTLF